MALDAGAATPQNSLSAEDQARLAREFAPVLVFHPDEEYFPSSPLFPLDDALPGSDRENRVSLLGTVRSRVRSYRALTPGEKAELATVYYRAYPVAASAGPAIVIEYWLYYVQNDYRVRGNLLPLWFDASHPNDLEHIQIVLRAEGDRFAVDQVYASAHEGNIPAHRYRYPVGNDRNHTRFLVELGSHALAPDIDEDGMYTPGPDGHSGYKLLWGIRDRGITWFSYNPDYMDRRSVAASVVMDSGLTDDAGARRFAYRLVPVASLEEDFARLALTDRQRKDAFEVGKHWFRRVFGGDDGNSDALLLPPRLRPGTESIGFGGLSSSERGVLLGATLSVEEPGLLLGGRYSVLHGRKFVPDLVFEADGILTSDHAYLFSQFFLSYPIDSSTRVMGGRELVTDSISFDRRQWNWIGRIEVRLGRMRVSATTRSIGPVTGLSKEFRLAYFF